VNGSVHIAITEEADAEKVRLGVARLLDDSFGIGHATIQVEREACGAGAKVHS
jgi:Co/Zn/Cd efflux system component